MDIKDDYRDFIIKFESYIGYVVCVWFNDYKYFSRILGVKRINYNSVWMYLTDSPTFICISMNLNEYNQYAITLKTLKENKGFLTDKIYTNKEKGYIILKE